MWSSSSPTRPLPLKVVHHKFEPAISLLGRIAACNGLTTSDVQMLVGGNLDLTKHDSVRNLAALASKNVDDLLASTSTHHDRITLNGVDLGIGSHLQTSFRCCSVCIANDLDHGVGEMAFRPWWRPWWLAEGIKLCPFHHVSLSSIEISQPPSFRLRSRHGASGHQTCWQTNFNWRPDETRRASATRPEAAQAYILKRAGVPLDGVDDCWLDAFDASEMWPVLEQVGRGLLNAKVVTESVGQRVNHSPVAVGFDALRDGESSFGPAIESLVVASTLLDEPPAPTLFKNLCINDGESRPEKDLLIWLRDRLKRILSDYPMFREQSVLLGTRQVKRKLFSFRWACNAHGLSQSSAQEALVGMSIKRLAHARIALKVSSNAVLLDEGEIDALVKETDIVTLHGLSLFAGVPVDGPAKRDNPPWLPRPISEDQNGKLYSRSDAISHVDAILGQFPIIASYHGTGLVSLQGARGIGLRNHDAILRAVLDGRLAAVGRVEGDTGFSALRFESDALVHVFKGPTEGTISIREAAARLKVLSPVIVSLVATGHLTIRKVTSPTDGVSLREVIDADEVEDFEKRHIWTGEAIRLLNGFPRQFKAGIRKAGIEPSISDPSWLDNCFFDRSQVIEWIATKPLPLVELDEETMEAEMLDMIVQDIDRGIVPTSLEITRRGFSSRTVDVTPEMMERAIRKAR